MENSLNTNKDWDELSSNETEIIDDKIKMLYKLTAHHIDNCIEYAKICTAFFGSKISGKSLEFVPFIPARLFKTIELLSIPKDEIYKTMFSSGTGVNGHSRIFLDRGTAKKQKAVLSEILKPILGGRRPPMLIIDSANVVNDRSNFSARGAAILGFSLFGRDVTFALDSDGILDVTSILDFQNKHTGEKILIFGFTSIIWENLVEKLKTAKISLDFSNSLILHGGGWKKLEGLGIKNEDFKYNLEKLTGAKQIFNYYGMVEQTGSIYLECANKNLHVNPYADILVRRARDFSLCELGEQGVVQVLSVIPMSYPGHSILTEDAGRIIGLDGCPCGQKGKFFEISGRLPSAEIRGCSDAYPAA